MRHAQNRHTFANIHEMHLLRSRADPAIPGSGMIGNTGPRDNAPILMGSFGVWSAYTTGEGAVLMGHFASVGVKGFLDFWEGNRVY